MLLVRVSIYDIRGGHRSGDLINERIPHIYEKIFGYEFWVRHLLFWGFDIVLEDSIRCLCFNVDFLV